MIVLLVGLVGLWLGTRWVMNGALGIARRFNLSHSFVGLAILAVGTDLPEVFVTLKASLLQLRGVDSSGIITGNAIGSSLSQITIILGIAGLLLNIKIRQEEWLRNAIALLASILLLYIFGVNGVISQQEGFLLLGGYIFYYILLLKTAKNTTDQELPGKHYGKSMLSLLMLGGLGVLIYSSHLVVSIAMQLAENWGVAQSFVGIALIGLGTSLPELAVSLGAAMRRSMGMSIGNIIGSNIFDGLVPIGLGGLISPTLMENNLIKFDLPVYFCITLLVLLFLKTNRGIAKAESITLIVIYVVYIILKLF